MEPNKRFAGDEPREERPIRHRLLEQGVTSHAGRGRRPALGTPSMASSTPLSSGVPAAGREPESERLRGYLEVTQATLRAAELEVEIIRAQLVDADGWVAGKSSPIDFASPRLLHPISLVPLTFFRLD